MTNHVCGEGEERDMLENVTQKKRSSEQGLRISKNLPGQKRRNKEEARRRGEGGKRKR